MKVTTLFRNRDGDSDGDTFIEPARPIDEVITSTRAVYAGTHEYLYEISVNGRQVWRKGQ